MIISSTNIKTKLNFFEQYLYYKAESLSVCLFVHPFLTVMNISSGFGWFVLGGINCFWVNLSGFG
jgi:hypothetical protein